MSVPTPRGIRKTCVPPTVRLNFEDLPPEECMFDSAVLIKRDVGRLGSQFL